MCKLEFLAKLRVYMLCFTACRHAQTMHMHYITCATAKSALGLFKPHTAWSQPACWLVVQTKPHVLAAAVALAFETQLVESVPTAPHDIDVDIVISAESVLACSKFGQHALSAAGPT